MLENNLLGSNILNDEFFLLKFDLNVVCYAIKVIDILWF